VARHRPQDTPLARAPFSDWSHCPGDPMKPLSAGMS
jgi:hypothetical protein